MPVGGILASKTGFRLVTIIGSLLTSAGILLSYLTINYGFGAFIITYSVMFGIGIGLPYSVLISIATSWFPKNRALIMGILSAGLCIGGLVFNPIQIAVINPHNIRNLTDSQVKDNVPKNFLVLGGLMLVLQVIGLCLCRKCKENTNTDKPMGPESTDVEAPSESSSWPNSSHSIANNGKDHKRARQEVINYTVSEALRSIDFYIIFFITFLVNMVITLQTSTYKVYGGDFNLDDRLMTIIVTVKSVLSCFEGMLWGLVNDKFSFKYGGALCALAGCMYEPIWAQKYGNNIRSRVLGQCSQLSVAVGNHFAIRNRGKVDCSVSLMHCYFVYKLPSLAIPS
ncbi:hypothetical protein AAHC03_016539 [Spirometra sp. Aus1]